MARIPTRTLTADELKDIGRRLPTESAGKIAEDYGVGGNTLIGWLKDAGYRVTTRRSLEPIVPVDMGEGEK